MDKKQKQTPQDTWTAILIELVGQCISDQNDGLDVLASAAWDDVRDHWKKKGDVDSGS